MFSRSLPRLVVVTIVAVTALLCITSLTSVTARLAADLIVNPGESIQAAIDAANNGDTILINAGTYTEGLTLSKPVSLTGVNSATTIIRAMAGQRVLTVTGATISNSVVISGLMFTGGNISGGFGSPDFWGGGILITESAHVLIQGVNFTDNIADRGGGLYSADTADLQAVAFISNTAREGGGIYAVNSLTLTAASFIRNRTTQDFGMGGGLYIYRGTLNLSNAQFIDNTAYIQGGGGYVWGMAMINQAQFLGNIAFDGGGLYASDAVTVSDSRFENNRVTGHGGGIFTAQTVVLTDTDFISNANLEINGSGGGLYAYGSVSVSGGRFENNIGEGGYGGLASGGSLSLSGTQFISNTGSAAGAGSVTAINTRFIRNFSRSLGIGAGGLFAGSAYLTNTDFISNTAWGNGGGLDAAYATLNNVWFVGNRSVYGSGGGFHTNQLIMTDSYVISNVAYDGGGGAGTGDNAQVYGGRFENNYCASAFCLGGGMMSWGRVDMTGTNFISNAATWQGGGLFNTSNELPTHAVNSLFARNSAPQGAALAVGSTSIASELINLTIGDTKVNATSAIRAINGHVVITNSIIASYSIGLESAFPGTVNEDYNLFYGNVTNTIGVTTGAHSFIGDPRFVDPAHDDYHLAFGSAAIDRGVAAGIYTDLDNNSRPIGPGFDIGAYEYQGIIYRAFLPVVRR